MATEAGNVKGVVIPAGPVPLSEDWRGVIDVDPVGVVDTMKAFSQVMGPGSSFVLFGSTAPYTFNVEFPLSDKASFVNGVDIIVDGGNSAAYRLQKLIPQF